MPDKRKDRGPHPADELLFAETQLVSLKQAVRHLSWLLTNGYAPESSLKLVGDRFALHKRQRNAVKRMACSDQARQQRQRKQVAPDELRNQTLVIDGFNVITTIEAALSGGVILHCRDGCFRDLASMHGTYRMVQQTGPGLQQLGDRLARLDLERCIWLLDRPVSNSGRLCQMIRETAHVHGWNWNAAAIDRPDADLIHSPDIVATADSGILDRGVRWFNLARWVVQQLDGVRVVHADG